MLLTVLTIVQFIKEATRDDGDADDDGDDDDDGDGDGPRQQCLQLTSIFGIVLLLLIATCGATLLVHFCRIAYVF
ncbi:hypothetical protein BOX15_Mlig024508g2 [Macrostomum lignano]|uniref:Uncharacterized protein n=1 Tax=Macrostomum lignano TaxID=282301 RepID=A0A267DNV9_9PLAT|nr:hypothetical protein BOX15_Mlig008381g3 [Macrostomum lignano]PAA89749.1 hypothetical protein BOX15_Mlig024508g2 [Macrostomum lignano]